MLALKEGFADRAIFIRANHVLCDGEDFGLFLIDMMLVIMAQRLETRQPARGTHVHFIQFLNDVVQFLVLGNRVTALRLARLALHQGRIKCLFLGGGMPAHIVIELLPELAALGRVAFCLGQLGQQVAMGVMVFLQGFVNRGHVRDPLSGFSQTR